MASFKDKSGKEWHVEIDVAVLRAVKKECDFDLLGIGDGNLGLRLMSDPILLCGIVYVVCRDQANRDGITDEQFGRSMGGDAIDDATNALLESIADFSPPRRRTLMKKAMEIMRAAEARETEALASILNGGAMERAIDRAMADAATAFERQLNNVGGLSTSAPESAESSQAG